jgi:hypothetical protein
MAVISAVLVYPGIVRPVDTPPRVDLQQAFDVGDIRIASGYFHDLAIVLEQGDALRGIFEQVQKILFEVASATEVAKGKAGYEVQEARFEVDLFPGRENLTFALIDII